MCLITRYDAYNLGQKLLTQILKVNKYADLDNDDNLP